MSETKNELKICAEISGASFGLDFPIILLKGGKVMGQETAKFTPQKVNWGNNIPDAKFKEGLYKVDEIYSVSNQDCMVDFSFVLALSEIVNDPMTAIDYGYMYGFSEEIDRKFWEIYGDRRSI